MLPEGTLKLHGLIREALEKEGLWDESLESDLPTGWHTYDDLILFPSRAFAQDSWRKCGGALWTAVGQYFNVSRLARTRGPVGPAIRKPNVEILLPGNGSTMVLKMENGIRYRWDLLKCMYSPGNTTEKIRVAGFDCRDKVVVDMFAGIGYFTLPYLVKAKQFFPMENCCWRRIFPPGEFQGQGQVKAKLVYAIDWNPDALEALARNVVDHKCQNRCILIAGDNRKVTPEGVADHVNLGYIPSCEGSYAAACRALNPHRGGFLHVHGNCDLKKNCDTAAVSEGSQGHDSFSHCLWAVQVQQHINTILLQLDNAEQRFLTSEVTGVYKVKSFGPRVDHLVVDLFVAPVQSAANTTSPDMTLEGNRFQENQRLALELYQKLEAQKRQKSEQNVKVKRKGKKELNITA